MILLIDVGNTNIVIGIIKNNKITHHWRINTQKEKTADDYAVDMVELFLRSKINCMEIIGAIIASVVPELNDIIFQAVKKFSSEDSKILNIGDKNVKINLKNNLKGRKEVGQDRIINSLAGFQKYKDNLIIIDFGTATTFDVVGMNGEYLGGIIAPGINLSLKSLHDYTSQLPMVNVKKQSNVIGTNTIEAINSGAFYGYISMIEGLVSKINQERNLKHLVIITGGLAPIFKESLKKTVDHHDPNLTLEGLKIIYDTN